MRGRRHLGNRAQPAADGEAVQVLGAAIAGAAGLMAPTAIRYHRRRWTVQFAGGGAVAYTAPPYGVVPDWAIHRVTANPGRWQALACQPAATRPH